MEMDVLYEKNDVRDAWNQKVLNKIAEAEKSCTPFPVSCQKREGVWGIWLESGDEFLLVNPIELVSSVFADDVYYLLEYYNKEFDGQKPKGHFYVDIRCENHAYHWRLSHTILSSSGTRSFTIEEYLDKTKKAIDELYQAWSKNEPVAYNDKSDVKLEALELCKRQMEIRAAMPSNHVLMNDTVQEEVFQFHPVEDEWNEDYFIGIGDRGYQTVLTNWDNDLECIRHQLETFVYERESKLKLTFDMSDTVVIIKKRSVLDHIEKVGEGYGYKYKDYVQVEIHPNEFVNKPILKGYCDEKETIRTMYEGLLCHAMRKPLETPEDSDESTRMVAYNKIKSPLIEAFLRGERSSDDSYSIRQVHVKHILTIDPDVLQLLYDEEGVTWEELDNAYDKNGKPIKVEGLLDWQKEIEPIVIASQTGNTYEKDWADYHRRGLDLAKQLRERLSTDFDLWYDYPFEDNSGTLKKKHLVF